MKKYILLFALVFAMAGITNAQTTETKSTDSKVTSVEKVANTQKSATVDKQVKSKVSKTATCKEMSSKSCCKKGKGQASASAEKACCTNMAEAKDGKACCDKMADKMKTEAKKEAAKKG